MFLRQKQAFSVAPFHEDAERCLYTVSCLGEVPLSFTAVLLRSDAATAKPSDVHAIIEWCHRNPEMLPRKNGGVIPICPVCR
jgi:hypothetical protein